MNPGLRSSTQEGDPTELRIDPHVHSAGSYDSSEPIDRLLAAADRCGLDGLVITDHDRIEESLRAVELAPEYGLVALPGVEVSTLDGHLLAIGVTAAPPPDRPFAATVSRIRAAGGVAVVPHPFRWCRHGVPRRAIHDCDGVETVNACSIVDVRNEQSRRFARSNDYPRFGGSDAHVASEVGRAYTEVALDRTVHDPAALDADTLIAAMQRGETRARGTCSRRTRSLRKYARNARAKATSLLPRPAVGFRHVSSLRGRNR